MEMGTTKKKTCLSLCKGRASETQTETVQMKPRKHAITDTVYSPTYHPTGDGIPVCLGWGSHEISAKLGCTTSDVELVEDCCAVSENDGKASMRSVTLLYPPSSNQTVPMALVDC